ncbi:cytochrome P450 family protein [Actinoallomurus acaciae]|uniref:Cytochrome P450 n=1 Tax=Actinoallomurus acaciae TaxID=502577 RepID=A0ABV5YND8_9ACTN
MNEPIALPYGDPSFVADPFPFYRRLREEGPVRRVMTGTGHESWMISRYDDVVAAMSDSRLSCDFRDSADPRLLTELSSDQGGLARSMLRVNPPDHTRLRRLVSKAFTARRTAELAPRIQQVTDQLLDAVMPAGRVDLVGDFALPLTVVVISELLGVPEGDRDGFQEWTDTMLVPRSADQTDLRRMEEAGLRMRTYLESLLAARQAHPGDDLLSALIAARDEDQRLDQEELLANVFLLLVAGHISTVDMIGTSILGLLTHPDQLKLLRDDPELLPGAIEEFLRHDGPSSPGVARFATEDIDIGGVTIPRGATVMVAIAIAGRDPARFPEPDRIDITRPNNAHLAFGHGLHYCIGAPLARLEGRIAISTVLRRLPDLSLAVPFDELRWPAASLRGPIQLPVTFDPS